MAGQPRRRALIAEVERRTRATFEDDESKNHLDYLLDWLQSGRTFLALTRDLNEELGFRDDEQMSHGTVSRYFHGLAEDAEERIKAARARGSYAIADSTADIADEKVSTKEDAARARNRIGARQWMAEKFNRDAFGQRPATTSITLSLAGSHLDALRVRVIEPEVRARESDMVCQSDTTLELSAIASAITQDAEVLSIEPAST